MEAPDRCGAPLSLAEPEQADLGSKDSFELPMIGVFVVADASVHGAGLANLLERETRFHVFGATSSRSQSLAHVAAVDPDVVLLDVSRDDRGPAIAALSDAIPDAKIVVCALPETEDEVIPCFEAGAAACLAREAPFAELVTTIERVASGESLASPRVTAMLLRRVAVLAADRRAEPKAHLTTREREILALIDEGLSNKQIAKRLCIELPTVKNHVHNILEKLHVHRRYEAVARIRRDGTPTDYAETSMD